MSVGISMSASPQPVSKLARSPDVLGELLHSLSQPLTSLQCSLELSIDEVAESQRNNVAIALHETGKVIGMIQLMREYLDAGHSEPESFSAALDPTLELTLRSVIEELSSIAAVRAIRVFLAGTSTARLRMAESRLRLALQYVITTLIEAQAAGGKVVLLLKEDQGGTVLRGEGERGFRELAVATATLRRVKLAIATRVFESAGTSLVLGDADSAGFVLYIPRTLNASR
jgi:signal transduction histidine kinase